MTFRRTDRRGDGLRPGAFGGGGEKARYRSREACWELDEGDGTTASDGGLDGNDGTLTNGLAWQDGKLGQALDLDWVDDYMDLGTDASLELSKGLTIEAWVKYDTAAVDKAVFGSGSATENRRISPRGNAFTIDCVGATYRR